MRKYVLGAILLVAGLSACSNPVDPVIPDASGSRAVSAVINFGSTRQVVDGFGASTAWHGAISETLATSAFSNGSSAQMGLSILRIRIDPAGTSSNTSPWSAELSNVWKAKSRGATILATPWTPPASMKSNNSTINGSLNTSQYANYATWLNSFLTWMSNANGAVDVLSLQNEPDYAPSYESCSWTGSQIATFLKNNGAALSAKVLAAEAFGYNITLTDPALNDSTAAANLDLVGGHLYGSQPFYYTNAFSKGKKVWMTEHYLDYNTTSVMMTMGKEILDCLANNMSAYIWWWLAYPNSDCNLMNTDGTWTNKGYVMAQFSKFVRPGYLRVDATYSPQSGVYVVAFTGTKKVVVVVNQNTAAVSQTFTLQNGTVSSLAKHVTSASKKLSAEGTLTVSSGSFTTTLDAQSVTTFTTL